MGDYTTRQLQWLATALVLTEKIPKQREIVAAAFAGRFERPFTFNALAGIRHKAGGKEAFIEKYRLPVKSAECAEVREEIMKTLAEGEAASAPLVQQDPMPPLPLAAPAEAVSKPEATTPLPAQEPVKVPPAVRPAPPPKPKRERQLPERPALGTLGSEDDGTIAAALDEWNPHAEQWRNPFAFAAMRVNRKRGGKNPVNSAKVEARVGKSAFVFLSGVPSFCSRHRQPRERARDVADAVQQSMRKLERI